MKRKVKQVLADSKNMSLAEISKAVLSLTQDELLEMNETLQKELANKNAPIPEGKYLTIEEVCAYLKVNRVSVWRYSKNGYLKPHKIGNRTLYARADIDDYLKNSMSHDEH